jgi:hypothetical protein
MSEDAINKNQTAIAAKPKPKRRTHATRQALNKPYCGLIMPISMIDACNEQHWSDVREILEASIQSAGFEPRMVSDADEIGIIQQRIIRNVYDDPVLVCDVSGKNPNVMFELGMRLAFDKPTIIVKDDKTSYTFDTAPIEHLEYPRDLRFAKIVEFQESLTSKIVATHKKAQTDRNYTTFLKNFGSFSVAKLESKTLDRDDYLLEELRTLKSLVLRQTRITDEPVPFLVTNDDRQTILRASRASQFQHAVRNALSRIPQNKRGGDISKLVLRDVLSNTSLRYEFSSMAQLRQAVDREIKHLILQ